MTKEEAIKIINCYDIGFYDLSGEKIPADKLAEALDMAIEALKERPNGKWKVKSFHEVFCNKCGFDFDVMTNDFLDKMNFCPNCGADMRGGDAE